MPKKLKVQFDGPGIHPNTLDSFKALEVVSAYLGLIRDVAKDEGLSLDFIGIEIIDKCAQFRVVPSDPIVAEDAAQSATRILVGDDPPRRGMKDSLRRCRDAIRQLPTGYSAKVGYGRYNRNLCPQPEAAHLTSYSTISVRATPVRVGGTSPKARFVSKSEDHPFSLSVTEAEARELGSRLYEEVDIQALVCRSQHGQILDGELRGLEPLSDDEPLRAWEEWFEHNTVSQDNTEVEGASWRDEA